MEKNLEPSKKVLFWDVGIKEYDLTYIEPIKWHRSNHEKYLDTVRDNRIIKEEHNFF